MNEVYMTIENTEQEEYPNWITLEFDLDDSGERSLAQELQDKALDQGYSVRIMKKA